VVFGKEKAVGQAWTWLPFLWTSFIAQLCKPKSLGYQEKYRGTIQQHEQYVHPNHLNTSLKSKHHLPSNHILIGVVQTP